MSYNPEIHRLQAEPNISSPDPRLGYFPPTTGEQGTILFEASNTPVKRVRYPLVLPENLYNEVKRDANEHDMSVSDWLRRSIRLWLLLVNAAEKPNTSIIIQSVVDGKLKEERLLFL